MQMPKHDCPPFRFRCLWTAGAAGIAMFVLLIAGGCRTAPAPASDESGDKAVIEPKADEILRRMSDTLRAAKRFSVTADRTIERITLDGHKIQFTGQVRTLLERPNRVRTEFAIMGRTYNLDFDGVTLKLWCPQLGKCVEQPFAGSVDKMLDFLAIDHGFNVAMVDLLVSNPYESAMRFARTGQYLGLTTVLGRKCHHLAYTTPALDWQIWIDSEGPPVPRKLVITYREEEFAPQLYLENMQWDFNPPARPPFPQLPADAKKVDLDTFLRAKQ